MDLDTEEDYICNKFLIACRKSRISTIKQILNHNINKLMTLYTIEECMLKKMTVYDKALYNCCKYGQYNVVKYLLEYNKKKCIQYDIHIYHDIMFSSAYTNGHYQLIEYLFKYSEEINSPYDINNNNCFILFVGCYSGNNNILKYLIKYFDNRRIIIDIHCNNDYILTNTIYFRNVDILYSLIEYSEKINSKFNKTISYTTLYNAYSNHRNNEIDIIKYLIYLIKHNYNNKFIEHIELSPNFKDIIINKYVIIRSRKFSYILNNQIETKYKNIHINETNYMFIINKYTRR